MSEDEDAENHIPCLREEANETATLDESNLKELLKMQISECEMLHSMFSNPEEFLLDCGLLVDIEDYIAGKTLEKPHQLNYTINFDVCQFKLEILVNLPLEYPHLEPEVFVRSAQLNRDQQKALNGNLKNFIANLERNEIIIGSVVAWLQENALEYFTIQNNETSSREPDKKSEEFEKRNKIFSRLWIYSHHIYSKVKRKMILDMADEYFLTGFCLPGKPGIICVEGYESDCNEWWQQVYILLQFLIKIKAK